MLSLSLHGFFEAIGDLFDSFVDISPAYWEFSAVYWEPEKIMTQKAQASQSRVNIMTRRIQPKKQIDNTYLIGMYCLISLTLSSGTK